MHTHELHIFMEISGGFPSGFCVTLRTLCSVATIVRIFVTTCAILGFQIREIVFALEIFLALSETLLGGRMTLGAFHLLMLELKLKASRIMIKCLARTKRLSRMTAHAGFVHKLRIEHIFVFVDVTVLTIALVLAWKNKLFAILGWFGRQDDVFRRLVTFHTLFRELLVTAGQLKVGDVVIECVQLVKALGCVAASTGLLEIFLFQLFLMNRCMTVGAEILIPRVIKLKQVSWFRHL